MNYPNGTTKQDIAIAHIEECVRYLEKKVSEDLSEIKELIQESKIERKQQILEMRNDIQNFKTYSETRFANKEEFTIVKIFIDKIKDQFFKVGLGVLILIGGIVVGIYTIIKNNFFE